MRTEFERHRDHSQWVHYDDYTEHLEKLAPMLDRLSLSIDQEKLNEVLAKPHSFHEKHKRRKDDLAEREAKYAEHVASRDKSYSDG